MVYVSSAQQGDIRQGSGAATADRQAMGVCRRVRQRYEECPYRALQQLSASLDRGVLTLRGRVGSFYMKQLAQTIAQQVDGVTAVVNHVEVT
jgi:osmotically-inducible protein OsmY